MYHYTYLLQNIDDGLFYIGVRSCNCLPENDEYQGSAKTVSKQYKQRCQKYILATHSTRKEAIAHEIYLHDLYDVARNPCFFNKAKQTSSSFDTTGLRSPRKGVSLTPETKEKLRQANLGKKQSAETIKKRSEKLKGHQVSAETRTKIGAKNSKILLGRKKSVEEKYTNVTNHTVYLFIHTNGFEELLTLWEFVSKFNITYPTHLYRMAKGVGAVRSYKGWRITSPLNIKRTHNEYQ